MALSSTLKTESLKDESYSVVLLDAIMISDPNLPAPLRYVNNTEDITINGEVFEARPFDLPRGVEGNEPGETTLTIDDADQEVLLQLEKIPPVKEAFSVVTLYVVLDTTPNTLEIQDSYDILSYDAADDESGRLSITLSGDTYMSEEVPAHAIEPSTHPAAFRSNQ